MKNFNLLMCEDDRSFVDNVSNFIAKENINKSSKSNDGEEKCVLFCRKQDSNIVTLEIGLSDLENSVDTEESQNLVSVKSRVIIATTYSSELIKKNNVEQINEFCINKLACISSIVENLSNSNPNEILKIPYNLKSLQSYLLKFGLLFGKKGFTYIVAAVDLIYKSTTELAITKDVYTHIAKVYNSSYICVEKVIRNAISSAYKKNPEVFITELSLCSKATNNEFIRLVVAKMKNNL